MALFQYDSSIKDKTGLKSSRTRLTAIYLLQFCLFISLTVNLFQTRGDAPGGLTVDFKAGFGVATAVVFLLQLGVYVISMRKG